MEWKTNWHSEDNYANDGPEDFLRLLSNLAAIETILSEHHQIIIVLDPINTDGYKTIPFSDLLNTVEGNLNAIRVFDVDWIEKEVTWGAGQDAPNFEDINRWESNAMNIYLAAVAFWDIAYTHGYLQKRYTHAEMEQFTYGDIS